MSQAIAAQAFVYRLNASSITVGDCMISRRTLPTEPHYHENYADYQKPFGLHVALLQCLFVPLWAFTLCSLPLVTASYPYTGAGWNCLPVSTCSYCSGLPQRMRSVAGASAPLAGLPSQCWTEPFKTERHLVSSRSQVGPQQLCSASDRLALQVQPI